MVGALWHDLGKLLLPPEILRPTGLLAEEQLARLQEHPRLGQLALAQLAWPWPEVLAITLYHHEKWDATGYPEGLEGEEIPWEAQIVAVADFCDTLLTPQPYREALDPDRVAALLRSQAGTSLNPILVRSLLAIWDRVEEALL
jgi:HD-GYP domain-containing protein (c-di-GMP phosphodiesterase class II)